MIAKAGGGWQTIIADLALILFMVSISAADGAGANAPQPATQAVLQAEPGAIYRAHADGPSLGQWLTRQPADPRQQLTVVSRYADDEAQAASAAALAWAGEARATGRAARIVLEPAEAEDLFAVLAFDAADGGWHDACSASARLAADSDAPAAAGRKNQCD
jgi:hypothetical protein